ncbi:MAG: gliding motility-associated C-terminal domain-containing protein [Flavobacteriales bacterium]
MNHSIILRLPVWFVFYFFVHSGLCQSLVHWHVNYGHQLLISSQSILQGPQLSNITAHKSCGNYFNDSIYFYTQDQVVYNQNNELVSNGSGLTSNHWGPTIAIPDFSYSRWMIFTSEAYLNWSLNYSIINLNIDGGFIESNSKNTLLDSNTSYWLTGFLGKGEATRFAFVSYGIKGEDSLRLLKIDRINLKVIERIVYPIPIVNDYQWGSIIGFEGQFSELGRRFVFFVSDTNSYQNSAVLSGRFDPNTGNLSQFTVFDSIVLGTTSRLEPSGRYLYTPYYDVYTGVMAVRRYDLSQTTESGMLASMDTVHIECCGSSVQHPDLQIGPFRNLIGVSQFDTCIVTISNPDHPDPQSVGYDSCVIQLQGNIVLPDLPLYAQGTLINRIMREDWCEFGVHFELWGPKDSVVWDFGDPGSGAANMESGFELEHEYSDTGWFTISATIFDSIYIDTIYTMIYVNPELVIPEVSDTTVYYCRGSSVNLSVFQNGAHVVYAWDSGSVQSDTLVTVDGAFTVTVTNPCEKAIRTFHTVAVDSLFFDLGADTTVCDADSFTIGTDSLVGASYAWSNGLMTSSVVVSESDKYVLSVTNACNEVIDSIKVGVAEYPRSSGLEDSTHCGQGSVELRHLNQAFTTYYWSDSTTEVILTVDTAGSYFLRATNACASIADSALIEFIEQPEFSLKTPITVCPTDTLLLNVQLESNDTMNLSFHWSNGDSTRILNVKEPGSYGLTVRNGKCSTTKSVVIVWDDGLCLECKTFVPNVFTPNDDGINDHLSVIATCVDNREKYLAVFNRWGTLLWEGEGDEYWDGTIQNGLASEGVYYYYLELRNGSGTQIQKGSFSLLR